MRSMTGYGQGRSSTVFVEISSVNRKGLEFFFSLPRALKRLEPALREQLQRHFHSGSVSIRIQAPAPVQVTANIDLARQLYAQWHTIASTLKIEEPISLRLLNSPDLFLEEVDEKALKDLLPHLNTALEQAIKACDAMRQTEGKALQRDLKSRLQTVRKNTDEVRKTALQEPSKHFVRFQKLLQQLGAPLDEERIAKEAAFAADRMDVAEELTRLESHFAQCEELLSKETPGRTLDFLIMEMQREATTIGNKNPFPQVLTMKSELSRMREQVANVE